MENIVNLREENQPGQLRRKGRKERRPIDHFIDSLLEKDKLLKIKSTMESAILLKRERDDSTLSMWSSRAEGRKSEREEGKVQSRVFFAWTRFEKRTYHSHP